MEARPVAFIQILNQSCQYSIPLWQRRYSWGDREIGQLMSDLELAAQKSETDPEYRHYCGAMITHTVGNPAGTINYHQVIDGQQRLTTISLLLQCVAQSMDEESSFGTWNRANIHQKLLTNQGVSISESRKLKLQDIDEKEYSSIIDNQGQNSQTNTRIGYAYKKLKQHIKNIGAFTLMKGFQHLWIVSIVLQAHDDPQQVFESLNTTGRPLTEGEKIKNWLLSGLDPESQSRLYQNYWREIEIALGEVPSQSSEHIASKDASKNIDLFFREFLFWKLGIEVRKNDVYLDFRKWAINNHLDKDKHELAEQLCLCARLYGFIIGTFTYPKFSRKIDAVVRRLREQPLDVHRPLTLRILHDKVNPNYFLTDSEISDSIQLWSVH